MEKSTATMPVFAMKKKTDKKVDLMKEEWKNNEVI